MDTPQDTPNGVERITDVSTVGGSQWLYRLVEFQDEMVIPTGGCANPREAAAIHRASHEFHNLFGERRVRYDLMEPLDRQVVFADSSPYLKAWRYATVAWVGATWRGFHA